jgi:hypothetical protein
MWLSDNLYWGFQFLPYNADSIYENVLRSSTSERKPNKINYYVLPSFIKITTCSNESQSERETKLTNHHGKAKTTTQVTRYIIQQSRQHELTLRNKHKPYKAL